MWEISTWLYSNWESYGLEFIVGVEGYGCRNKMGVEGYGFGAIVNVKGYGRENRVTV